jgi:hypothetical protein
MFFPIFTCWYILCFFYSHHISSFCDLYLQWTLIKCTSEFQLLSLDYNNIFSSYLSNNTNFNMDLCFVFCLNYPYSLAVRQQQSNWFIDKLSEHIYHYVSSYLTYYHLQSWYSKRNTPALIWDNSCKNYVSYRFQLCNQQTQYRQDNTSLWMQWMNWFR